MAKRKRTRLGLSPKAHMYAAGAEEISVASDAFRRASRWAKEGQCGSALRELLEGENMRGELNAHRESAGRSASPRLEKAMMKGTAGFEKYCVVRK